MSRMKHILRKLHIGGSVNDHQRLGESRHQSNSSPSPSPSPSSSSASGSSSSVSSSTFSRNRVADGTERTAGGASAPAPAPAAAESSVDFNFFEEEFQVQLALAISASDPDMREDPESVQIKAAKRMSLGCPPSVSADETLVEFLSLRYWNYNVINYDEKVIDGFYDVHGIAPNSGMPGKMPSLLDLQAITISDDADYEVILVNRSIDPALQQLERKAVSIALECRAAELGPILSGLVQKVADLVVDSMGGPVSDADEMLRRWTVRSYELRSSLNTIILPLGCLDVGLSRHRALLFKVLADQIDLPCRLVKGSYYTGTDEGAVNLIKVNYGSEYIIDLMGAPGTLIPAELPSSDLQNSGLYVRTSLNIEETVSDSCSTLNMVSGVVDNKIGILGGVSPDLNHVLEDDGSKSDITSSVGAQSQGNDGNLVAKKEDNLVVKNQTERFEHDFGQLLPSLRRSREGSSGIGGKASSAEKMKVKDVSKYVISAAQNPEFAQKLHAVLLESGASPPPDLFSSIAPQNLREQKVVIQNDSVEGKQMVDVDQGHRERLSSSIGHFLVPFIGGESSNHLAHENKQKHSSQEMVDKCKEDTTAPSNLKFGTLSSNSSYLGEGFVLVDYKDKGTIRAGTTGLGTVPVPRNPNVEHIHDSSMPREANSSERPLENDYTGACIQCSQGDAGIMTHNVETNGGACLLEHQQCPKGSVMKFTEIANVESHTGSNAQSERINPMLDEVAEWEIPWEDLQIGERIGLGSYGEVYRADWNGTEVAVKKFLDQDFSGDALEQFRCEVKIMRRLRHPNVVLFMGAVMRPPNLSILTEFLPRGSLYRLLHRPNVQIEEKRRLRMALDVAKGMNYLHTSHPTIVHRDLKSPNLLVDKNWVVKVCDFGLSRLKHHTFLSSKSTAGTPEWMAPEVLRNEPSNEKCDVYSFGVILWELATLQMPWSGMNPMQVVGAVGFQHRRLEIPEEVDPMVAQIIRDCWQREPNLRPSFSQLMSSLKHLHHLVVEKT